MHDLLGFSNLITGEAHGERQLASLIRLQAEFGRYRFLEDLLGSVGCHFLDIHAAFSASHHDWHAGGTVENHSEIDFSLDVSGLLNKQA